MFCTLCGTKIPESDFNVDYRYAKCQKCSILVRNKDNPHVASNYDEADTEEKLPVPIPPSVTIDYEGNAMKISWKWNPVVYIILAFVLFPLITFPLLFLGASFLMLIGAIKNPGALVPAFVSCLFNLPFLAIGFAGIYAVAAGILNKTVLHVSRTELSLDFKPLKWFGQKTINAGEINQIYCQEYSQKIRSKHHSHYVTRYSVNVLLNNGRQEKLLSDLGDPQFALFIEEQIENHLDIPDRSVPGEMKK